MEKFLRDWRQDALNKAQYDAAIFIGDKLLALTNDDQDAFWLAQVHFATGNYTRAQAFLSKQDLISRNPSCRYLAGHCLIKQSRYEEALVVLGERNPTHLISNGGSNKRKGQLEMDDWTYLGMGAGVAAAWAAGSLKGLGGRGVMGAVGAGGVVGGLAWAGWRFGVNGGRFKEKPKEGDL
ncbi:hypothetical protein H634G_01900 [Metarhizium anisopliae BRIP 53293]|uniref:Mitochondrial import receptor subunit n=1 Tax=Metarhizium anisopliae BRIP 53293 TaxID=1291518 RepID=A0A0D9P9D8_METAN|nr:hypothetical protein H634G_01900 [Metarhizium anisopliae BRIP 53293]